MTATRPAPLSSSLSARPRRSARRPSSAGRAYPPRAGRLLALHSVLLARCRGFRRGTGKLAWAFFNYLTTCWRASGNQTRMHHHRPIGKEPPEKRTSPSLSPAPTFQPQGRHCLMQQQTRRSFARSRLMCPAGSTQGFASSASTSSAGRMGR